MKSPKQTSWLIGRLRQNAALRICLIYGLVSTLWILLSDQVVYFLVAERVDVIRISIIKGITFVLTTSGIIFVLIRRGMRALRESEQRYRLLFQHSPVGIVEYDRDLIVMNYNRRFVEIIESFRDFDIGLDLTTLEDKTILPVLKMSLTGQTGSYEGVYNGSTNHAPVWIFVRSAPLLGKDGQVKGGVAIIEDISERRRAEQGLRDAEKQYREMFEHAGEGIYQSTPEGRFLAANPMLARMLGYESPADLLEHVADIERQLYVSREERAAFRKKLEERGSVSGFVSRLHRKDGTTIWVSENARVVRNGSSQTMYYEGALQDITERRSAEEALLESEQRYRALVEMSPDAIAVHSEGALVYANPAAAQLLRAANPEDLVGRPVLSFVHPQYHEIVKKRIRSVSEKSEPAPLLEEKFIRLDGTLVDVEVAAIPFTFRGKPAVQVVIRDITGRNQAEREIRLLAQTVASTKDCVAITDLEDNILFVNDAFLETYGYAREELVGQHTSLLRSPLTPVRIQNQILPATLSGGWYGEIFNRRKDGTDFPIELWTSIVKNEADEPVAMVGVTRDITARRKAEETMRKLLSAIEQSDEVIFMTERDGTITYVNPAFEKFYGFKDDEVIGQTPRVIKSGMLSKEAYAAFWSKLLTGESVHAEIVNKKKGGELVTMEASVNPVFDGEGAITGFIAIQDDITERKRAEEERKMLELQLLQAQKIESVGTLAGGIAHDFNNILGIILGHATLLERNGDDPSKFLKGRDAIITAVQRGASLVQQILTFARKTEVSFETVDVNETVTELVKMLEETFPKTISFALRLAPEIHQLTADRTRLHQTLLNLCVNARDAMPEGGTLTIATERVAGEQLRRLIPAAKGKAFLCVAVSDTGTGMDEATQHRLFEPFFTTKPTGKGTGLGLAVVHGIMRRHDGHIRVKSTLGQGTSFYLYFPAPEQKADTRETEARSAGEVEGGRETILIVEDEVELRELVRALLESKGYEVLASCDGEEAIRTYAVHHDRIALVISDMGLPKMGGAEVFRRMKTIDPEVKAVLVSGYFEPETKAELLKAGARGFLSKPYVPSEVLRMIRQVLSAVLS